MTWHGLIRRLYRRPISFGCSLGVLLFLVVLGYLTYQGTWGSWGQ